jgi:hypothetical protein
LVAEFSTMRPEYQATIAGSFHAFVFHSIRCLVVVIIGIVGDRFLQVAVAAGNPAPSVASLERVQQLHY